MCKISGVIFDNTETNQLEIADTHLIPLLLQTEGVNTHATGIAVVNSKDVHVYKNSKSASDFVVDKGLYDFINKYVSDDTFAIINHCRFMTQGTNLDNSNNHPIIDDTIVGVHNGVLSNDLELRNKYGAVSDVDSAVIFSTLKSTPKKDTSINDVKTTMDLVEGSATIVVVDKRNLQKNRQELFIATKNNPMNLIKYNGSLWFASTKNILSEFIDEMESYKDEPSNAETLSLSIRGMSNHTVRKFTHDSVEAEWWNHSDKTDLEIPKITVQQFNTKHETFELNDIDHEDEWKSVYSNDLPEGIFAEYDDIESRQLPGFTE